MAVKKKPTVRPTRKTSKKTSTRTAKKAPALKPPGKTAISRPAPPRRPTIPTSPACLRDFCRSLPHTTEDIKWGHDRMFSIGGKIYAGFDADLEEGIEEPDFGFKCSPDDFDRLTEKEGVIPAPYAAKHGWVRVTDRHSGGEGGTAGISNDEWRSLIRKSYELVASKLPKKLRTSLGMAV